MTTLDCQAVCFRIYKGFGHSQQEQVGRLVDKPAPISPLCTDNGCACSSPKSHIHRLRCFRLFKSREHIYFYLFNPPYFSLRNVRCKVREVLCSDNFTAIPAFGLKNVRCKLRWILYDSKILTLPYLLIGYKNIYCITDFLENID